MDYAALAAQHGAIQSNSAPPVDYAALAAQHGAVQSQPAQPVQQAPQPQQPQREPTLLERFKANHPDIANFGSRLEQGAIDTGKNVLAGAADIGATAMLPLDALGLSAYTPSERRQRINDFAGDSAVGKTARVLTNIAGTAGAGGALAQGVRAAVPTAEGLATALETGGMATGGTPAAKALSMEAAKNAATRIAGGAGSSAAMAGMVNPDDATSAAALGGVLPIVGKVAGELGRGVRDIAEPIVSPYTSAIKRLSGAVNVDKNTLKSILNNPTEYVKGSIPSTAQVLAMPEAVQLEKALKNNPEFRSQMEQAGNANNAARLELINKVAGNPGDLEGYTKIRADNAQKLYDQAFSEYTPESVTPWVKGQITQLTKRPAMQEVMAQAKKDALNEGIKLTDENSIQGLHFAKMALDKKISTAFNNDDNVKGLMATKDQLINVMGKLSPTYKEAMAQYAHDSIPVNTMQVGRDLQDKLWQSNLNSGGDPAIAYQQFKTTLAKSLKGAEYGIHPDAHAALQDIQNDLQRQTISNSLRFPGSDTQYNKEAQGWLSKKLYGEDFSGSGGLTKALGAGLGAAAGSLVGHPIYGASIGAGASLGLSKLATSRVNNALADIMASPKKAAEILDRLPENDKKGLLNAVQNKVIANPLARDLVLQSR